MLASLLIALFTFTFCQSKSIVIENKTNAIITLTDISDDLRYGGFATSRIILQPNHSISVNDNDHLAIWQVTFLNEVSLLIHYGELLSILHSQTLQEVEHIKIYKTRIEFEYKN